MFCEKPVAADPATRQGSRRLRRSDSGVPVQIGFPRRFDPAFVGAQGGPGRPASSGSADHRAVHHAGPGAAAARPTSPAPAASSATARSTTSTPCAGSPAARSSRCTRPAAEQGRPVLRRDRRRRHRLRPAHLRRRHARRRLQHPLQRPRLRRAARAARLAGLRRRRARRRAAAALGRAGRSPSRPGRRTRSSWTGFADGVPDRARAPSSTSSPAAPSPCTLADGLESSWIAEACARSLAEHRPVRLDEVRQPAAGR